MNYKDVQEYYQRRKEKIILLKKAGLTLEQIAAKYGVSKQRIGQIIGKSK